MWPGKWQDIVIYVLLTKGAAPACRYEAACPKKNGPLRQREPLILFDD